LESSSTRSDSSLERIAVDDIASVPPRAKAAPQPSPATAPTPITSPIEASTWKAPSPNTMRFMLKSRGKENSSPIVNIRKTTPNSAR